VSGWESHGTTRSSERASAALGIVREHDHRYYTLGGVTCSTSYMWFATIHKQLTSRARCYLCFSNARYVANYKCEVSVTWYGQQLSLHLHAILSRELTSKHAKIPEAERWQTGDCHHSLWCPFTAFLSCLPQLATSFGPSPRLVTTHYSFCLHTPSAIPFTPVYVAI